MLNQNLPLKQLVSSPIHLASFGFGSGFIKWAPGTFGTLAAIPFYLLLEPLGLGLYLLTVSTAFMVGIWLCNQSSNFLKVHDHPGIVWDEFVGYWITMIAAPAGLIWIALGFIYFRIFDILKPWPIKWLDSKVKGGFGIMIDDVLAGIFAFVCLQITAHFFS